MKTRQLHALYASGNFGKSTASSLLEFFALFYFTDVLGIAPELAGTIILASLIWDGIADPVVGVLADRFRLRFGSIRPFFLLGAPLTSVALVGLFLAGGFGGRNVVPYVIIWLLLFRSAYTIVDIPHNSMLSFLTHDARQRTNIASLRIFFSAVGRMIVTLASIFVLSESADKTIEWRFTLMAIGASTVFLIVMFICMSAIDRIKMAHRSERAEQFRLRGLVSSIRQNRQLWIVFGLTAITSLTTHVYGSAFVYFGKYALGDGSIGGIALTLMSVTQAASLLFWSKLSNRMKSKRVATQYANAFLFATMVLAVIFMQSAATLYLVAILTGFSIGGIYMLNWSMLPDALDHGAPAKGRRYDMSVFSLYSLTNKVFTGTSNAYVGWVLAAFGYSANSAIASENIQQITSIIFAAPMIGALVCFLLARTYKIMQGH